jgi:hypothetical protein
MTRLSAELKRPDWIGDVVAVDADKIDLNRLLRAEGLLDRETESLVAIELYMGDDFGGRLRIPQVRALLAPGRDRTQVAEHLAETGDPVPLRAVEAHVTVEEFMSLFKHVKLVLTRGELELQGRSYVETA